MSTSKIQVTKEPKTKSPTNNFFLLHLRTFTLIASIVLIFFASVFFMLFTDLYLSSDSAKLFLGIILGFGAGVSFVLGESFRHKKVVYIILKTLALVLTAGLATYLFIYQTLPIYKDTHTFLKLFKRLSDGRVVFFLDRVNFQNGMNIEFNKVPWFIMCIVVVIVSFVTQAYNFVATLIRGTEE